MMRVFKSLTLVLYLLAPFQLSAQSKAQQPPAQREFQSLIADPGRGFPASQHLLNNSFAAHLHQGDTPLSLTDLDQLGAAYDPRSTTPLTAGMLYFHLAHPVNLLRQLGTGEGEILARVIEARLRWLAGDTGAARFQLEDLIVQYAAIGGRDDNMVSMLVDAAILAWRDGETDRAQTYLTRAQACAQPRCPTDFVFDWLGPNRKAAKTPYEAYDPDTQKQAALRDAPILSADLGPGLTELLAEIEQEANFVTGDWMRDLAQATSNTPPLSDVDKKSTRHMADRLLRRNKMLAFLMNHASVASDYEDVSGADGALLPEKLQGGDIAYIGDARWDGLILDQWPIFQHLYRLSDQPGDVIVAQLLEARLLLSADRVQPALVSCANRLAFVWR